MGACTAELDWQWVVGWEVQKIFFFWPSCLFSIIDFEMYTSNTHEMLIGENGHKIPNVLYTEMLPFKKKIKKREHLCSFFLNTKRSNGWKIQWMCGKSIQTFYM